MTEFVANGVTLSLAWFVAMNAFLSTLTLSTVQLMLRREQPGAPGLWLAFRLGPAALSIAFVVLVFAPSYWRYEPREGVEGFDLTLTAMALSAIALLGAAIVRGFAAWRSAARRLESWLQGAGSIMMPGPPPDATTNRWFSDWSETLHAVNRRASSRASS